MPNPDWADAEEVFSESPQAQLEILGVGSRSRKSKTLLPTHRAAYLLSRVRAHLCMLMDMMRRSHAHHHKRPVFEVNEAGERVQVYDEQPDGSRVPRMEPEVLTDHELLERYSALRAWKAIHQEIVDHSPSVTGLSIRAATHLPDEDPKSKQGSSAGSERREW